MNDAALLLKACRPWTANVTSKLPKKVFRSGAKWAEIATGQVVLIIGETCVLWWHYANEMVPHPMVKTEFTCKFRPIAVCPTCRIAHLPSLARVKGWSLACSLCLNKKRVQWRMNHNSAVRKRDKEYRKKNGYKYRLRGIWKGMLNRCYKPKALGYKNYGGRGITVCDRWVTSFDNFRKDMGDPPSPSHQLERRNNNGNYEPGNCTWVTAKWQARNRRTNRLLTAFGETKTVQEWSETFGIHRTTILYRIDNLKWEPEQAIRQRVSTPQERAKRSSLVRYGHE